MSGPLTVALITGAGGFVGRWLIDELERETDWRVLGIGRQAAEIGERTRVLACDLRDADLTRRVVAQHRPNIVFHLAAQSYVPKAIVAPADTIVNNVVAQINVLEACRETGIDATILVVGSSEEYGAARPEESPLVETQPFRPGNPYAVSKVAQDMLGLQYALSYGMKIVRVRPFNHFGPGQSDRFVMATFARQIAQAELGRIEPAVLTGNLAAARDFLDVRDITRAYRLAVERCDPGEVYNIASGKAWPVGDLLDRMIDIATIPIAKRLDPARMRPSDAPVLVGDSQKFRRATGWQPRVPIEQSLLDTLNYWRDALRRHDMSR